MATLFDSGLGEFILPIFVVILIYAILFAVLKKTKIFGDGVGLNSWIAFALSVVFAFMPGAMKFIAVITPWFVAMVVLAFSFLLVAMFMGYPTKKLETLSTDGTIVWTTIIVGIIIVVGGLTAVYGPVFAGGGSGGDGAASEVQRTVFNPKVLTAVFAMIIFAFAIKFLSYEVPLNT